MNNLSKKKGLRGWRRAMHKIAMATIGSVTFITGVVAGIPKSSEIANDTALYQNLSEVKVQKVTAVSFDNDLKRLSAIEKQHHENLPVKQKLMDGPLKGIVKRVQAKRY